MEVFVIWFMVSVAVGILASNRGRSGFGWFVFSIVLSPLLGLLFVLVLNKQIESQLSDKPTPQTHVRCPECRELVLRDARKCKHCFCALVPQ
jgi:phosphotransferase system  glucose/maltose/N-acetylglucosamine-specific IIC component